VNNLLSFLPASTCVLAVASGLLRLVRLRKSNRFGSLGVAGLGLLLVGAIGVWKTGFVIGWKGNPPLEWSDGRTPELEPLIRKHCVAFLNQGRSVGLVVGVVGPTNATVMAFGRTALSGDAPTRGDTMFEIGSITKTFTAIALAREIERGTVRLDQPAQELLPAGVELPESARAVTLRHLTTHTSGFPRMTIDPTLLLGEFKMAFFGGNPYAGYTDAIFLDDVRHVKLRSKPGTTSNYSNFGVGLLGYLLATRNGVSYETFIKREVCHPLVMDDTTVTLESAQAARFARGYRALLRFGPVLFGLRSDPWQLGNQFAGAGGLRSTGVDMLKYLQANMHPEGQPIEHALRESHRELFHERAKLAFGMNWVRSPNGRLNQTVIWHNGGTGGFRSYLGFTEDGRVGVVVLSNTAETVDRLGLALLYDLAKASALSARSGPATALVTSLPANAI